MSLNKNDLLKTKGETGALSLKTILENIIDEINGGEWINLSLEEGISVGSIGGTPQYRKIGNRVYIRGGVAFTAATNSITLARLPVGFRPKENCYITSSTGGARIGRTCVSLGGSIVCDWIYDLGTNARITGDILWYNINIDFSIE